MKSVGGEAIDLVLVVPRRGLQEELADRAEQPGQRVERLGRAGVEAVDAGELRGRDADRVGLDIAKHVAEILSAALGGSIDLPGLDGSRIDIKIPAGVQSGKQLRVRGWLKSYNGPMIDVTHPEQIEVLEE